MPGMQQESHIRLSLAAQAMFVYSLWFLPFLSTAKAQRHVAKEHLITPLSHDSLHAQAWVPSEESEARAIGRGGHRLPAEGDGRYLTRLYNRAQRRGAKGVRYAVQIGTAGISGVVRHGYSIPVRHPIYRSQGRGKFWCPCLI